MTGIINKTETYKPNLTQYGGEISVEDFNTYSPNKKRINNQIDANTLSSDIRKKQKEMEMYNKMTLEELREKKIISNTDGRPISSLTDEKWQKEFDVRKLFITPYKDGYTKKLSGKYSKESGTWNEEINGTYDGCTNWQSYCTYINDVLKNIRSGQVDYCYYIFQILDLLKFHYDDLKTKYCDGYWEVWLEKGENGCKRRQTVYA